MIKVINQLMSLVEAKEHRIVLALVALVIISGIFYSFYLGDNLRFYDEHEYYNIAKNLSLKQIFSLDGEHRSAFRPPVYPALLSIIILMGGSISHLRVLNFIAFGFSIYILYLIVKNHSSRFAGLIAALFATCYPVLFYAAGILLTEHIGIFLFLLILLYLDRLKTTPMKYATFTGVLFGLLILTVPSFIFSMFVMVLWSMFSHKTNKIKTASSIVLVAFFIIGLWSVRNYTVFNTFVFVSTHGGRALYTGNFEGATPNPVSKTDWLIPKEVYTNLNEAEQSAYFKSKAIEYMLKNKTRTIRLYFLKVLNYFNYQTILSSDAGGFANKYKDIIMLLTYGPLLVVFLLRILFFKKFKLSKFELLLIILYFSNAFFLAIFQTRLRYRLPFDFLLIAVVAMFISNLVKKGSVKTSV